jgi:hypothetical protein
MNCITGRNYVRFIITLLGVITMTASAINAAPKAFFPLMAWDYAEDETTLKSMADCGINIVAFVPPKALDTCQKLGIKAIVWDEKVGGESWAKPFNGEKACKALPAFLCWDLPGDSSGRRRT